ncbi:hypothetical protein FOA43_000856 [Brettanomyces nanus]|uniref:Uncharacterized protein n=1 Tax=Eeniella nana TaxID=13502 RepID=A0A875S2H1_EENNA|nr:uncharacterized protein FOA43_000856 [Brettanomyces nanus]QPG73544.1 hypothetical protein FOA43_000856 [Brettanomyces nanus]
MGGKEMKDKVEAGASWSGLAHQFMDTNFIHDACCNSFTILPAISDSDAQLFRANPPEATDYLSSNLDNSEYSNCWKAISNNNFMRPFELSNMRSIRQINYMQRVDDVMLLMPSTSSERLENACWRAWSKSLNKLRELDPAEINWYKINDVTCLYGPVIKGTQDKSFVDMSDQEEEEDEEEGEENGDVDSSTDDDDSLSDLMSLRNSLSISSTSISTSSTSVDSLKSILKKPTKQHPLCNREKTKKRISFCPQVQVGIFYDN